MRKLALGLAVVAAVSFSPMLLAGTQTSSQTHARVVQTAAKKPMHGTVLSVDAKKKIVTVTSKTKAGVERKHHVKVGSDTKITLDGKTATLSELKEGQQVSVTAGEGRGAAASEIDATSSKTSA